MRQCQGLIDSEEGKNLLPGFNEIFYQSPIYLVNWTFRPGCPHYSEVHGVAASSQTRGLLPKYGDGLLSNCLLANERKGFPDLLRGRALEKPVPSAFVLKGFNQT